METGPGTFVKITKNVMEGSTANYRFSTYDDYSDLASAIKLRKGVSKPKWRYFLRAESFYNVASALMTKYNDDGKMQDLHARSHGESFLDFIQRADQPGLYIMDEPEAALSPQRQLTLLIHLVKMAQEGCTVCNRNTFADFACYPGCGYFFF